MAAIALLSAPTSLAAQTRDPLAPRPTTMSVTVEGQELQITPLAGTTLSSVVATPLAFKLLRVTLPAGQAATYATGATGLVYQLSGAQTVTAGGQTSPL